jgi:hypothetical protein
MRIRIAGHHGGRQREEGRRRETGSAARTNGRADSARLRIAQIDRGRAQRAMDSAPEREGKRRREKVVSVSVSASESLEARREARANSMGASWRFADGARVGERQRASMIAQKRRVSASWSRRSGG